jgi:hypothetical protein
MNQLEKINKELIRAETWDDFIKIFRNHKWNKGKTYADTSWYKKNFPL